MTTRLIKFALCATSAIGLCAASAAAAQTTPGDQSGTATPAGPGQSAATSTNAPAVSNAGNAEGGDIIVTARRSEERLQDVPISITVFNQQQLTNRNVVNAQDLATYTPSLATNSRFGNESTTFAIRGFTQETQTAPSVAVYFADVTAPRAQGGTSAGNGAGPGAFFDLQNVQVLKGPQGTLFGRNTTGGAVLLVPQKPTGRFEGYVEGSIGNYDLRRIQAVINAPLGESVRLRVGVDRNTTDGYLRNRSAIGPKDFNDVDYTAVRGSLVVDLAPNLENYSIVSYTDSDTNGLGLRLALTNPAPASFTSNVFVPLANAELARAAARGDGYYDFENGNSAARQHIRQLQAINTTTLQASDTLTIKNIASYATFKQGQSTSLFGENFFGPASIVLDPRIPAIQFLAAGQQFGYVNLFQHPGTNNVQQWTATEELQFQGRTADDKLTYQGGVYYERSGPQSGFQGTYAAILLSCTNVQALQCSDPLGAITRSQVGSITESFTKYSFRDLGVYAQATYKLTDQLSLTGGLRYTSDRVRSIGEVRKISFPTANNPAFFCSDTPTLSAPTPATCRRVAVEKSSKPTWLIDLDYKPTDDILLYGKYARGYRQGGVNTSNPGFQQWGPEKVDSYEVGAKTSFSGAGGLRGTFNVAAFYNDFSNQQLQANAIVAPPAVPVAPVVNAGKSRIGGVEVDASITPFTGLTFDAAYAYLDTKLKSFTAPPLPAGVTSIFPTAIVGGDLTLSPKNRVTLTGTYTLPLDESIGRVSFGATFTHTDRQLASAGSPNGTLPSTDLLNLNLNWNSIAGTPLDVSLFATNVTKQHYYTYVAGAYASAGYESVTIGQPRMYGARLRYRFGG